MSGSADETNIQDENEAGRAFSNVYVIFSNLHDTLAGNVKDLTAAEAAKYWGTDPDIGGKFEENYNKVAPTFKEGAPKIAQYTADGHHAGYQAMMRSLSIDQNASQTIKDKIDGEITTALNSQLSQLSGGSDAPGLPKDWQPQPPPQKT